MKSDPFRCSTVQQSEDSIRSPHVSRIFSSGGEIQVDVGRLKRGKDTGCTSRQIARESNAPRGWAGIDDITSDVQFVLGSAGADTHAV